ncbi:K(+)-transporting ATPase subunit C [Sphingobacterium griseoflavum]|uniref:Potassium-transporting ATPase KdpC subunit n=1 Tax=Sphingobacterium griseoflavum TaxID=1474952 RepID=A0ABQ3HY04_9SPHI|nr:K(+)-transporting ATPase subunit C [Sphingobacterium griseoflavum]GHE35642.1 potassium-transporting ATPase KdpC subunit [Sphingobacterium griseoflavum]
MKTNITKALRLTLVCLVFFSGVYTMAVWAVAQLVPGQGKGFTIEENGKKYHVNVGQAFTQDKYFWSRPSAVDYNAAGSGGSNLGPSNPEHLAEVQARIEHFLEHNPDVTKPEIPSDLVTSSGGGLDPHISVQGAKVQAQRVAKIRGLNLESVNKLIDRHIEPPLWGIFGTKRINVLQLNLALDKIKG